jgi:hypothetical protein
MKIIVRKDRGGKHHYSLREESALCEATYIAYTWATHAKGVLDKIWKQKRIRRKRAAWRKCQVITRFMGANRLYREEIRKTRLRVTRIAKKLGMWTIRFTLIPHQFGDKSYGCEDGTRAYASPSTGIKLCPNFFDTLNKYQRAQTIIHELVHMLGWRQHFRVSSGAERVFDTVNHRTNAIRLADHKPWRARRNAVNYAWMLRELYFSPCPPVRKKGRPRKKGRTPAP